MDSRKPTDFLPEPQMPKNCITANAGADTDSHIVTDTDTRGRACQRKHTHVSGQTKSYCHTHKQALTIALT